MRDFKDMSQRGIYYRQLNDDAHHRDEKEEGKEKRSTEISGKTG